MAPGLHRLEEDAKKNEGDAKIEREIDFATFTKDKEGKDNRITGFEIVGQVDCEGREAFQRLNLEQIHTNGAEQRMTEHKPQVGAFRNDNYRLLTGEEPQIDRDDGRNHDKSS